MDTFRIAVGLSVVVDLLPTAITTAKYIYDIIDAPCIFALLGIFIYRGYQ